MGRDPHWGVSGSSHILGAPVLGSNIRKTSLLGWLEQLIEGMWEAWTQLREAGYWPVFPDHSGTHPSLRKTTMLVPLP